MPDHQGLTTMEQKFDPERLRPAKSKPHFFGASLLPHSSTYKRRRVWTCVFLFPSEGNWRGFSFNRCGPASAQSLCCHARSIFPNVLRRLSAMRFCTRMKSLVGSG